MTYRHFDLRTLLTGGAFLFLTFGVNAQAGSATWNLNPTSGDWNMAANWSPATVPNGPFDTGSFDVSNTTGVSILADTEVDGIAFNPGASSFTLTVGPNGASTAFTLSGAGITNNSAITQNFVADEDGLGRRGLIIFMNSAIAGNSTVTNKGSTLSKLIPGGTTQFFGSSSAGSATFINLGGLVGDSYGGWLEFYDTSTAANATVNLNGGAGSGATGGLALFHDSSTAHAAMLVADAGGLAELGAIIQFGDTSTAESATLIANGGILPDSGGLISFLNGSTGGTARAEVFGMGRLDISDHDTPGVGIGSIEGSGKVFLGANNLFVGANDLDTTFSGVISGPGSVTKIGSGTLTLNGPNTYSGRTQVKQGRLFIEDQTGLLTVIKGSVVANGGTFGGSGLVGGSVVIGSVSGRPGVLEPNQLHGGNFIIQKSLTFNPGATCQVDLNSNGGRYSNVWAKEVTINEGALFTMRDLGNSSFGEVNLGIINNTGSNPIVGTFSNLPEGGSIVVGQNTFYATYHGGDGNDLLLTTVP